MRLIKTFILRFYTDSEQREQFCGDLRAVPGHKSISFKKPSDLFALLLRLVNKDDIDAPMPDLQDEIDPDLT